MKTSIGPVATAIAAALVLAMPGASSAAPRPAEPGVAGLPVVQARGCHRDPQRHFVPEWGIRAWHYHRGPNCRPVEVEIEPPRDCHRDVQSHYLPEYGAKVPHRHVGPGCDVRILKPGEPGGPGSGFCVQIGPIRYCEY